MLARLREAFRFGRQAEEAPQLPNMERDQEERLWEVLRKHFSEGEATITRAEFFDLWQELHMSYVLTVLYKTPQVTQVPGSLLPLLWALIPGSSEDVVLKEDAYRAMRLAALFARAAGCGPARPLQAATELAQEAFLEVYAASAEFQADLGAVLEVELPDGAAAWQLLPGGTPVSRICCQDFVGALCSFRPTVFAVTLEVAALADGAGPAELWATTMGGERLRLPDAAGSSAAEVARSLMSARSLGAFTRVRLMRLDGSVIEDGAPLLEAVSAPAGAGKAAAS